MKIYKKEVVIASFRESLTWVKDIPSSWKVTVYNTDPGRLFFPDNIQPIRIPNFGREAGQWAYHLCHRYETIAGFTVFLQADKVHETGAIDELLNSPSLPEDNFRYVGGPPDRPVGDPPFLFDAAKPMFKALYGDKTIPTPAPFRVGAQFYVRRKVVHNHPKDFYERLLKECHNPNPPWSPAHLLEPIWGSVFNRQFPQ